MSYPSDLVRTKNWGTEVLTDADLESQFDLIINWVMASLNDITGHGHTGAGNDGPNIDGASLTGLANLIAGAGKVPAANLPVGVVVGDIPQLGTVYVFAVSGITVLPIVGATYTNNGITYTVIFSTATFLYATGSGDPLANGTLTNTGGTGDATVTFSAFTASPALPVVNGSKVTGLDLPPQVGFGAWVDKSASYGAQQAATDGFVICYGTVAVGGSIAAYTDANANPTTVRGSGSFSDEAYGSPVNICMPVKKGNYWKIVQSGGGGLTAVYWIPLGS